MSLESAQPGELLPAPTGPYAVGRTSYHWLDERREDVSAPLAGSKRELVAWVWYPAEPAPEAERAAYLPAGWEAVARVREAGGAMSILTRADGPSGKLHGLAILGVDPGGSESGRAELVFVNLVGTMSLEQLGELREGLDIPGLDALPSD